MNQGRFARVIDGRYRVVRLLGKGGFGTVYLVEDQLKENEHLALKLLAREGMTEEEIGRLKDEFHAMAMLRHPGIARARDFGTEAESGRHYLTRDYIPGVSLLEAARLLPADSLPNLFVQICGTLHYMHGRGVHHQDLKPQNILVEHCPPRNVRTSPRTKLLDFGLGWKEKSPATLTGTVHYAAPEAFMGGPMDGRSDLYSLGVIFYQVMTGRLPFDDGKPIAVINAHLHRQPEPPRSVQPNISRSMESIIMRLLEKEPARRFSTALDLREAIQQACSRPEAIAPVSQAETQLSSPSFNGRGPSLEAILAAMGALKEGGTARPAAILVRGPAGIGKSRLIREFRHQAQLEEIPFYSGTCPRSGGGPCGPFLEILRAVTARRGGRIEKDQPSAGERQNHLLSLVGGTPLSTLPEKDQAGIPAAIEEFLVEAAKREPLILHLADLQWCDQLSIEIFRRIAERKGATPLLLIADLREEDAPGPVRDALAALSRNPGVLLLDLAPLDPEEILGLIRSMLGTSQDFGKLARLVHRCTGGNPLFAAELMNSLFEEGSLKMVSGRWRFDLGRLGTRVPGSVGEMISRRLERLESKEVELLMVIAAFDRAVPATWVAEIERKPEPEIRKRLENLSRNGLLETEPASPSPAAAEPRYRIRHRPFRDVLYQRLGARARPIHLRIGALLEGKETDPKEGGTEELAWHFARGGDRERGLRYCLEGADRAEAMHANDRAIMHLESALHLLGRGKKSQRAGILFRSGQVLQRIGDHAASIRNFRKAQEIWADLGDRQGQVTALDLIAWAHGSTGKYEQALKFANRGLEIAERERHPAGMAKCLNTIGMVLSRSGSGEKALDYYRRALVLWKEIGDKKRTSSTLNNMGLVCLFQGRPEESLGYLQKSLALRKRTGDCRLAAQSLNNIGLSFKAMGRHDEALHSFQECVHLAREVESRTDQATALFNMGETEVFLGQYDGALETYEQAITLMEEIHNRHHIPTCLDGMGKAYERLGETASAAAARGRALEEARRLGDEVQEGFALASLAFNRFQLGEETDALGLLKEAGRLAEKLGNRRIRMRALESKQRIALAKGNRRRLRETADRIATIAGESDLPEDRLLALRARADALMAAGAWGDAEGILAEAERLARELGRAESHLEILSRLARCALEQKDLSRAADRNREAAGEIKRIASRIQEGAMRDGYLRSPERKQVLDRAETDKAAGSGEASPSPLSTRALMTLHDISRAITSILSIDELLERVMDLAIDLVGAERGILFVHDEASGEMRIRVARNAEKETLADASKYSSKVLRASREGRSILALDAGSDDRFRNFQSVSLYHIRSLMCVPLVYQERILGTVYLDTRQGRKNFSEEDLRFLEVFAGQAAVAMENASLYGRLEEENRYLKRCVEERYHYGKIIGKSPAMRTVYDLLDRLSESSLPVLVQGESGTGKELVARAIHFQSPRKKKRFVSENCAALPENLLESELFGHVKGAFTGADHPKDGLFLVADGGTLFLDEIADMSLAMQSKILRAIQEGEIRPVGSTTIRKVDVRVVSATNQPPEKLIETGKLRQDLYYRLSVLTINLPPLRDRKEDIPLLCRHFLDRIAKSNQKPTYQIGQGVMDLLLRYSWPGNVRELENTLSRLALFTDTRITLRTVELDRQSYEKLTGLEEAPSGLATLDEVERLHILRVLEDADGDRARAARMLGISRATIFRKLKQYNLD